MSTPAPAATILIVDNEPRNRRLLEVLLQPQGYLTRSAADGPAALASIAEQAPDLILLDVMMPGMNGNEVAAHLKANPATASIPIVMVTAQVERGARLAALDAGAEEYLTKPVDRAELYLRVRNLLRLKTLGDFFQNHSLILEREVQARTASLAESELRFRQLADNIRDVFFLREAGGGAMLYVSPAYEEVWGRSRESLYADPSSWGEAIHPEDRQGADDKRRAGLLAGRFEIEYRIVRPDGALRWIKSRGFPVRDEAGRVTRIAGIAEDITARKEAEGRIRAGEESMRRFASAMDATADAIYLVDRATMRYVYVNDTACRMLESTREELLAMGPAGLIGVPAQELEARYDAMIASGLPAEPLELPRTRKSGKQVWVELRRHALRSGEGWTIVTLVRDITEQRLAQARIVRLNRVYAVLSGINGLIVRAGSREELFKEACRIAVEAGGFRLAWIGVVEPRAEAITPVAAAGAGQDYLEHIPLAIADRDPVRGLPGKAVQENRPLIVNDIATDERVLLRTEALERGLRSLALLPLAISDEVTGLLGLYADTPGFFDEDEMRLLAELAGDIAFAVDHIGKQERLEYLAYYDELTGLANRGLFLERVAQHVRGATGGGHQVAVFLMDLDRFKSINDSLGRPAGDALLQQVAGWLTLKVGDPSLLARLGADEFGVVVPHVRPDGNLPGLVEKTTGAFLNHPFHVGESVLRVAAKVGVALFPDDGGDAESLLRNAEAALKKAKASGEPYLFHTRKMTEQVAGKLALENQLRQALDRDEFVLHYQPKMDLQTGRLAGAEALLRWHDPLTGLVPPGRFIPVLEEIGLIHDVGRWAIGRALADRQGWLAAGLPAVRTAVNVSALQLRNRGFIAELGQAIAADPHAAVGLELEITESLIMENISLSIASLRAIRAMGITVAIDDFGTGFSSLSHLARLPVDTLKIDRSFIVDMTASPEGLALVSTIITLAHSLKLKVVAEGVETEEQSRLLRLLDCDEMQGYLFSKPVPAEVFAARFLSQPRALAA